MHSIRVVPATKTEHVRRGLFGETMCERKTSGHRVVIYLTKDPRSAFESRTFYETRRGADAARDRIVDAFAGGN